MHEELLARASKGDKAAFGEIVDIYYKDAYMFALSITGNVHDAMDVCQESFIKAYKSLKRLKEPNRFKSWMMKIVSNTSKDIFRSRKQSVPETEELFEVFEETSLLDRIDLYEALMRIKTEYRQVLVLRFLNDLKISDVAKILRVPQNTVKSRTRYALEQTRIVMEGRQI